MPRQTLNGAKDLKDGTHRWALKIGVRPKRVQIQRMTKKWASCSISGRVCLNRDLLVEDIAFQEVVIVHELLHLLVPNHGKLFKSLMKAYLPRWEEIARGRITGRCGYEDGSRDRR
jgi:predicted metal-dependent hydrolase